ncbi:MAG: hypothetical protein JKY01_13235 [Pseudomonadales bacterium]|nr:hypothetical protein [Pseudomonadales bacterium]
MQNNQFLHQRDIPGINHQFIDQWEGIPLTGCYLIESTLTDKTAPDKRPVILIPGGFDPIKGSYSANAITKLLNTAGVSAVYELHFFSQGESGYIDVDPIITDLCRLLTESNQRPVFVGMSASTCMLSAAINEASKQTDDLRAAGALLIGAYLPDNVNLLGRLLAPFYLREKMHEKLIAHCGHRHLFDNTDRMFGWWKTSPPLRIDLKAKRFKEMSQRITIDIETLFFKIDTLSMSGKRILKKAYNAKMDNPKIPGQHRSLLHIPEFDELLCTCCQRLIDSDTANRA